MAHLHELLAVEGALKGRAAEMLAEAEVTFTKKQDHFLGLEKTYTPFDEKDAPLGGVEERKELAETVISKLEWVQGHVVEYLDAVLQKELTNQTARADLEIDGVILAGDLPATFLLGLETKLQQVRKCFAAAPTMQPGVDWRLDPALGDHVHRAVHDRQNFRTKKTIQHKVLVQPTKEHPAQIEKWTEDIPVGRITQRWWTGTLSVARKAQLLGRIDKLIDSCRQARQRANTAEVVGRNIGSILFNYIHAED
jgi:hypothetical protein